MIRKSNLDIKKTDNTGVRNRAINISMASDDNEENKASLKKHAKGSSHLRVSAANKNP